MKNPLFASFFFTKNDKDSRYGRANSTCSDGVRACVSSIEKAKVGRRKRDRYLISRIRSSNSPATAKSAPKSFDPPFHFSRATTDGALQFCNYVSTSLQRERDSLLFLSHTINILKFLDDGAKEGGKNALLFSSLTVHLFFLCVSRQNRACCTEKSKFGRKHARREGSSTRRTDVASAIRTEDLLSFFIELPAAMRKMPKQREKRNTKRDEEFDLQQSKSSTHRSEMEKSSPSRNRETKRQKCREKTIKTKPTQNTVLYHTIALLTVQQ